MRIVRRHSRTFGANSNRSTESGSRRTPQRSEAEAIDAWTTALELDPTSSGVRYQLGMELHEVGRYEESIPHMRHGWDLSIGGTDTIVALAHAQVEIGDRDSALQSLQAAVDVDAAKMGQHLADARFDALRKDPRFAALVARAKE
jgi:hypothetical protein